MKPARFFIGLVIAYGISLVVLALQQRDADAAAAPAPVVAHQRAL